MTILQAIQGFDAALDNPIPYARKVAWLSELDGEVFRALAPAYGAAGPAPRYDVSTDPQKLLLIGSPFEGVYEWYLRAQALSLMGEAERAAAANAEFIRRRNGYIADYYRSCTPEKKCLHYPGRAHW